MIGRGRGRSRVAPYKDLVGIDASTRPGGFLVRTEQHSEDCLLSTIFGESAMKLTCANGNLWPLANLPTSKNLGLDYFGLKSPRDEG